MKASIRLIRWILTIFLYVASFYLGTSPNSQRWKSRQSYKSITAVIRNIYPEFEYLISHLWVSVPAVNERQSLDSFRSRTPATLPFLASSKNPWYLTWNPLWDSSCEGTKRSRSRWADRNWWLTEITHIFNNQQLVSTSFPTLMSGTFKLQRNTITNYSIDNRQLDFLVSFQLY